MSCMYSAIRTETPEARQVRMQQDRQRHRQQREVNPDMPLFEQPAVSCELWSSTSVSLALNISLICIWLCSLTGLSVHIVGGTSISLNCISAANNMSPRPVPPQLQVHDHVCAIWSELYLEVV